MDRVVDITRVLIHEIEDYVATGMHDEASYFVHDDAKQVYAYVTVPYARPQNSAIILLARVTDGHKIIIDTDITDTPLYNALIQAGVPRSQIIRAYAGKTEPEP